MKEIKYKISQFKSLNNNTILCVQSLAAMPTPPDTVSEPPSDEDEASIGDLKNTESPTSARTTHNCNFELNQERKNRLKMDRNVQSFLAMEAPPPAVRDPPTEDELASKTEVDVMTPGNKIEF